MKKILQLNLLWFLLLSISFAHADDINSPIGYWQTIDDVSHQPKSILHIYAVNGALNGEVVKIYPRPGQDQNAVCAACTGSKHNQRVVGMIILEGLKQDSKNASEWSGGYILDPHNGKTYNCTLQIAKNNQTLNVRGYLGFSLFGRTQTWVRVQTKRV